ncbi:GumC family protein [Halalkalibaculum sp. DA384]|uniref:GumC family protein n=1 Tax=Halalkalibaculum sp. DA384 TaxID=3373606 RepID=UPI003754709E
MANSHYPNNGNEFSSNGSRQSGYQGGKPPERNDEDEIDLKRLFYILWNNKWLIIGCVILFSILAGVVANYQTPIYRSEASMLITQQQNRYSYAGSDLGNLLTSTYGIGAGSTIANEMQVLQSRRLSTELADTLINRRLMENGNQYPILFTSYPEDSTLADKDVIAGRLSRNLTFSKADQQADVISIGYESPSPLEAADIVNFSMQIYMDVSTRQNRRAANSAVDFLENERERIEDTLQTVENRLQEFMNENKLVQVDAQTQQVISTIANLESRKQETRVQLVAANSAIEQYRERLNNIKPGLAEQYADAIGPNMTRLQYQLAELEIEKMQLVANNPGIDDAATPPDELKKINEKIEVYRKKVRELTQNLIDEGDEYLGFLGNSGGNISQAVTDINSKLIELQVQREQYNSQLEVINEQLQEHEQFFDRLPDNMIRLARLKREVEINEELFVTVSQQYSEMTLWKQTQFGLGRPIDTGYVSELPVKPNSNLYILVGFILGGILSVGYIFVREAFNTTIDSLEKLRRFGPPLLAVIPKMDRHIKEHYDGRRKVEVGDNKIDTGLVTLLDTVSPISESFRRLESNIIYSNPDRKMRSILITSSTKGEGKTTVASNLGVVLAEAGYNVLLIDTDLRRPNLHNMFGLSRSPGIIEMLFDDLTSEEAIKESIVPNLSILTSGKRPPNPSAINQSRKLINLVQRLEEQYDYVLVDSAPYGIITDPSALIKEVDGVLLVTKFGETNEAEVKHTIDNLNQINAHIIGSVLSSFDHEKSNDYYYGSQYYYGSYYYRDLYEDYKSYHRERPSDLE